MRTGQKLCCRSSAENCKSRAESAQSARIVYTSLKSLLNALFSCKFQQFFSIHENGPVRVNPYSGEVTCRILQQLVSDSAQAGKKVVRWEEWRKPISHARGRKSDANRARKTAGLVQKSTVTPVGPFAFGAHQNMDSALGANREAPRGMALQEDPLLRLLHRIHEESELKSSLISPQERAQRTSVVERAWLADLATGTC